MLDGGARWCLFWAVSFFFRCVLAGTCFVGFFGGGVGLISSFRDPGRREGVWMEGCFPKCFASLFPGGSFLFGLF